MSKKTLASALLAATVLGELAKAASLKPNKDEELKDFAPRVATDVSKLPDADFDKLSKPAQDYFNAVAAAVNEEKEIPEPTKSKGGKAEPEAEAPKPKVAPRQSKAAAEAKPKAKVKVKAKVAAKPAAKVKVKAKVAAKGNGGVASHSRSDGVAKSVYRAVVAKPDITFEDLVKKLGLKGATANPGGYAFSRYKDAQGVMEVVNEK